MREKSLELIREYHLGVIGQIKAKLDQRLYSKDDFRHYRSLWNGVYGWLSEKQARWLFEMAKSTELMGDIVEIGSAYGRSTVCLGWGASLEDNGKVFAAS